MTAIACNFISGSDVYPSRVDILCHLSADNCVNLPELSSARSHASVRFEECAWQPDFRCKKHLACILMPLGRICSLLNVIATLVLVTLFVPAELRADTDSDSAYAEERKGNYQAAIRFAESHVSRCPCSTVYKRIATCYRKLGDMAAAERYIEIAASLGPNQKISWGRPENEFAGTLLERGWILTELGKYDKAERSFETAIQLNPEKERLAYCTYMVGQLRLRKGQGTEALPYFLRAGSLGYERKEILLASGRALSFDLEFERAMEKYELAIDEAPAESGPYLSRVILLMGAGRWNEAVQEAKLDCVRTRKADEGSQLMAIAGYLAAKAGMTQGPEQILREIQLRCDKRQWPYPIIRYLLGDLSSTGLHEVADSRGKMTDVQSVFAIQFADKESKADVHQRWVMESGDHTRLLRDLVILNATTKTFSKGKPETHAAASAVKQFLQTRIRRIEQRPYLDKYTGELVEEVRLEEVDIAEIRSIRPDSPEVVMKRALMQRGYTANQAKELIKMAEKRIQARDSGQQKPASDNDDIKPLKDN